MLIGILSVHSQQVSLHGAVMDEENLESIQGVHVFTSNLNGVVTDIDGNFYISVVVGDTIQFRMLGFDLKKIAVVDTISSQEMIVVLTPSSTVLKGVEVMDYFRAESVVVEPEKKAHRVTGVNYPENPKGKNYRLGVGGAIFSPATAIQRLVSKSYKEEKRAHQLEGELERDAVLVGRVKEKVHGTLALNNEKIDDYYLIDFIRYLGLSIQQVDHMYVYDLAQVSKGKVEGYLASLEKDQ